jgi:chemotaxis protein MotB
MRKLLINVFVVGLTVLSSPPQAPAEPLNLSGVDSVRLGEAARTFAAGFIRKELPADGVIDRVTGDNQAGGNKFMIGGGDQIYVKMYRPDQVALGDVFTLYRRLREVYHPVDKRYLGDLFLMVGIVEVLRMEGSRAVTRVVRSYGPITAGDTVMRFVPPPPAEPAPDNRQLPTEPGVIVSLPQSQVLVAQSNVVYIDWGRSQGLRPGDRLEIFRTGGGLPRRTIGELQVLATEDVTASALVIKSTSMVLRGDQFLYKPPAKNEVMQTSIPTPSEQPVQLQAEPISREPALPPVPPEGIAALPALAHKLIFEPGEATLSEANIVILWQIGAILKSVPGQQVRIEGHTDNRPIGLLTKRKYPTNQALSIARAEAVGQFLVERVGINPDNVIAVGLGATQPIASNATEEGRKQNRRVEFVLVPATSPTAPEPTPVPASPADALSSGTPEAAPPTAPEPTPMIPPSQEPAASEPPPAPPSPAPSS